MPHLQLKNFACHTLQPFDLDIQAGECVTLTGTSGSGKSLLLRAIADLDPHQGEVLLDGVNSQTMPAHQWRRKVGLLPAESHWWAEQVRQHFSSWSQSIIDELGFSAETAHWSIARLSSGERQRLGLARLLAQQPQVLLLDEPTANLDPDSTQKVETVIKNYAQRQAVAILWVSHDLLQHQRVADRQLQLHNEQIIETH